MKKTLFLLIIFHFSLLIVNAQWVQQPTGITADLFSIKFINKNTGWACGSGVILKTTNSGNYWISLSLPVSKPLEKIFPVDSNVIYCVGMFETIIKSTNGGYNWLVIRDGTFGIGNSYYCCHFINRNTGWISGGGERKILKTTNGGITFDSLVTFTSGFIKDIYFNDSLSGLYCDNNGAVRKSTNGGSNWFSVNIPVGTFSYLFHNFSFINYQTGWVVVDSRKVFKTTDFGSNWDSISNIPNGSYGIHCIFFSSQNIGWAVGEGFNIFKSTNGGYNWFSQNGNGGHSIFFKNDSIGWEVGNLGKIFHTTNGGGIMKIFSNNEKIISEFVLYQNYPNPFNPTTNIKYRITKNTFVNLKVYDLHGKEIETPVNQNQTPGIYEIQFDASSLASGVYFYKIQIEDPTGRTEDFVRVKKMVLIK